MLNWNIDKAFEINPLLMQDSAKHANNRDSLAKGFSEALNKLNDANNPNNKSPDSRASSQISRAIEDPVSSKIKVKEDEIQ